MLMGNELEEQIYNLVFQEWNYNKKSKMHPEVLGIIHSYFGEDKEIELDFPEVAQLVHLTVRDIVDFIEIKAPELYPTEVQPIITKIILRVLGVEQTFDQMKYLYRK